MKEKDEIQAELWIRKIKQENASLKKIIEALQSAEKKINKQKKKDATNNPPNNENDTH